VRWTPNSFATCSRRSARWPCSAFRGGYDWSDRYPWIVESALKNCIRQFVIDGEAVVLGVDGVSDFEALHSRRQYDEKVQLYAFDILALDGEDLRSLPLSLRKANLTRLLARRPDGIFVAPFEQGEIGLDLFRAACNMTAAAIPTPIKRPG
jgi:bifunctional non-homologous end joining protein LigD